MNAGEPNVASPSGLGGPPVPPPEPVLDPHAVRASHAQTGTSGQVPLPDPSLHSGYAWIQGIAPPPGYTPPDYAPPPSKQSAASASTASPGPVAGLSGAAAGPSPGHAAPRSGGAQRTAAYACLDQGGAGHAA